MPNVLLSTRYNGYSSIAFEISSLRGELIIMIRPIDRCGESLPKIKMNFVINHKHYASQTFPFNKLIISLKLQFCVQFPCL